MQTNGQTRKHSADETSVREKEKSQSSRAGFHRGLDSASVRKEVLKGQSSFASATGCFVKGAAGSLSPGSAGCGQLRCPRRSKRKAVSSLQSPSCMPREEQGRGKTSTKLDEQGGSSCLCSRAALALTGLSHCKVQARLHLLSRL